MELGQLACLMKVHYGNYLSLPVAWHSELTCKEYDQWVQSTGENATKNYLQANTKQCPKCGNAIEKDGGCEHMTCRMPGGCGYEFCW